LALILHVVVVLLTFAAMFFEVLFIAKSWNTYFLLINAIYTEHEILLQLINDNCALNY
jgi:hypothetical protein